MLGEAYPSDGECHKNRQMADVVAVEGPAVPWYPSARLGQGHDHRKRRPGPQVGIEETQRHKPG